MSADNDDDNYGLETALPEDLEEVMPPLAGSVLIKKRRPAECIAQAALTSAMGPVDLERITGGAVLAVVLEVPSTEWVAPVEKSVQRLVGERWKIFARDGSIRSRDRADIGNDEVAHYLSAGRCVAGIAAMVTILPSALVAAADIRVKLKIDGEIVAAAISDFTDASCDLAPDRLGGLDLYGIASAFRGGSGPDAIVERLRAMVASRTGGAAVRLPRLKDTVFGEARRWATELVRDYRLWQQKLLPWSAVSARCLLYGDPGLGKTFLAQVLANELGVPLTAASVSQLFADSTGYLHAVIQQSRNVWRQAENLGGVLIWDEGDSLPKREDLQNDNSNKSYWTPLVTDFLLMLDSAVAGNQEGLIVLMATNYPDRIDPALTRPGRLDRKIRIQPPDVAGIEAILWFYLDGELKDQNLSAIALTAMGSTPAELAQFVKAARSIAREAGRPMSIGDLAAAISPPSDLNPEDLFRICLHEAGHAIAAINLAVDEVVALTVGDVDDSLARTLMRRSSRPATKDSIERRVVMRLAGRAAEIERYGDALAGSGGDESSDLGLATSDIASLSVTCGLGDSLVYLGNQQDALYVVRRDPRIRAAVEQRLQELQQQAMTIVRQHAAAVEAVANALVERRFLDGDEIRWLYAKHPAPRDAATAVDGGPPAIPFRAAPGTDA